MSLWRRLVAITMLLIMFGARGIALADDSSQWSGASPPPSLLDKVGVDQRLGNSIPLDITFKDETGKIVKLGDFFNKGKPVALTLNYFSCPMLCPLVLDSLANTVKNMDFTVGKQYEIITVAIDPREGPRDAAKAKEKYLAKYNRPGAAQGWHFLTGSEQNIRRLADAVGVRYAYDAKLDQYAHPAVLIVLTPEGKISKYFMGLPSSPTDLKLGLIEASGGKIGSIVDQAVLFCYHYNPVTGKYDFVVMNLIRAGFILTTLILGSFVFYWWRRDHQRNKGDKSVRGVI